jgi:hypothetical protein
MRQTAGKRLLAAAIAASVLTTVGCGESAKPLTRAQLLHRADVICHKLRHRFSYTTGQAKTQQEFFRQFPKLARYEQEGLAELSRLIPPAKMAEDWKMVIAGAQTVADDLAKLSEYLKVKNLKVGRALVQRIGKVEQRTTAITKRDGFKDCAQFT